MLGQASVSLPFPYKGQKGTPELAVGPAQSLTLDRIPGVIPQLREQRDQGCQESLLTLATTDLLCNFHTEFLALLDLLLFFASHENPR